MNIERIRRTVYPSVETLEQGANNLKACGCLQRRNGYWFPFWTTFQLAVVHADQSVVCGYR